MANQSVNISLQRGTLNLIGNFQHNDNFGGTLLLSSQNFFGIPTTNGIYNITGNFKGSPLNPSVLGINSPSLLIDTVGTNCVFNITGNAEGGDGFTTDDRITNAGIINSNSTCIIQGEIIAIGSSFSRNPGIVSYNSPNVFIKRAITGAAPNYTTPYRGTIRFNTTAPEIVVPKQDNTVATLSDPALQDYPSINDVRDGVEYGFLSYEGNLIVPPSGNVSLNYNYDSNGSVTGSAILTPQNLFTAISGSSDPVAERLRNVSTVGTTGDQIVAFFP
jgi:hypothetical protein